MRVRLKFQKYGAMKFIGHLDLMRYFQKAFRRAKFDNEYTKGFNPHQIMSFAAPLGLGLTSEGEYLDIELRSSDSPEAMIKRINAVLTEGFRVSGFYILKEVEEGRKSISAMALVSAADYMISLKDGYEEEIPFSSQDDFQDAFKKFLRQDEILIEKRTKKAKKIVDLKTMIKQIDIPYSLEGSIADEYKNGIKVFLQLDTGSRSNLKPELVMEAFCKHYHITYNEYAWQVHRLEMYARGDNNNLIPLKNAN